MATSTLNINVVEKRMLIQSEAANYAGLNAKLFKTHCPVQPVQIKPGRLLWDKREIDKWLDGIQEGTDAELRANIIEML